MQNASSTFHLRLEQKPARNNLSLILTVHSRRQTVYSPATKRETHDYTTHKTMVLHFTTFICTKLGGDGLSVCFVTKLPDFYIMLDFTYEIINMSNVQCLIKIII